MDRSEIFEKLSRLERQIDEVNNNMTEMKNLMVELVEENVALHIENDNLKSLINKDEESAKQKTTKSTNVKQPLRSKDNLAMLYKEGFHICKGELFGKHRKGDDCLFCLEVLSE
ncbi:DNA replication initiation control protein YabA [Staphylococcus kloosii]|uniref:DNA replication initiation control protein YabA n=1 Tax=Staphylococcus kloosii TaxID=29384 RepID=UPI00189F23EF|nr:DNA replication initiation control protein YabA [Staphylococcus kloosii]MBF7025887.1 DNA replication initiation control protein YabA [Staphylococcus kloosii]